MRDWGIAVIVAAIQVGGGYAVNASQSGVRALDVFGYVLLVVGPLALGLRRVRPLPVLGVTLAACGLYLAVGYGFGPVVLAFAIAFLTAAVRGNRWWTYPVVPAAYLLFVWPVPALLGRHTDLWAAFGILGWLAALVAAAEVLRQWRIAERERRARAAAARRDEKARRERSENRRRLATAHELHDALAHNISVINVQSSMALELFDKKPQQARSTLAAIKIASRESLAEVHKLLGVIRAGVSAEDLEEAEQRPLPTRPARPRRSAWRAAPRLEVREHAHEPEPEPEPEPVQPEPVRLPDPSIDDLDVLLRGVRADGLNVETKIVGEVRRLPGTIDVAAATIILESLDNVLRHAPGAAANVTIRYTADSLDLTIDNSRPTTTPARTGPVGNGIITMRKRIHALGGALTAGPRPSGGYRVAARLPSDTGLRRVPAAVGAEGNGKVESAPKEPTANVSETPEPEKN